MNIYERPTPRTDAAQKHRVTVRDHEYGAYHVEMVAADFARRLEQELETCRDAHMANCLAADTLRREIQELREQHAQFAAERSAKE